MEREKLIRELFDYCESHPLTPQAHKCKFDEAAKTILGLFADFIIPREQSLREENAEMLAKVTRLEARIDGYKEEAARIAENHQTTGRCSLNDQRLKIAKAIREKI